MKKQVLFLIVLAFFAGTMAFGQALPGSAPRPMSCVGDALHPIAGNAYTYTAAGVPAGGDFLFWATKDPTFIETNAGVTTNNLADSLARPTDLVATSSNYGVTDAAASVSITWSDAILNNTVFQTNSTFVAVYYNGTACADNFKAWEIDPLKAFTVDVTNIDDDTKAIRAYDAAEDQCTDVVRGAVYNTGAIAFDYGADTLYFEVVAANFTVSWTPTLSVTGLNAVQTPTIEWTYDATLSGGWVPGTTMVLTNETNTSNGVSIYVRVIIDNANYENLSGLPVTLVVDGQNSVSDWDIVNATCVDPGAADGADTALQTINPRPTLTPTTPVPFIPGNSIP